jgi:NAD(P)H-flavin reductase
MVNRAEAVNPYLPMPVRIERVTVETEDRGVKTFEMAFLRKEDELAFHHLPGQFAELSVFGKGEAPFAIASPPSQPGALQLTVSRAGLLTSALHVMERGQILGLRGPLGSSLPLEEMQGKDLVVISGGFGFTTPHCLINYVLQRNNRQRFGELTVVYGARTPGMLLYKGELRQWRQRDDLRLHLTVDSADDGWEGRVGLVPAAVREVAPSSENAYVLLCGPPAMIRFTLPVLEDLGFPPERVLVSLEMRMKCGIGICGRCNIGHRYVCRDGPVFSLGEMNQFPAEY